MFICLFQLEKDIFNIGKTNEINERPRYHNSGIGSQT